MWFINLILIPIIMLSCYYFGFAVLTRVGLAILTGCLIEYSVACFCKKKTLVAIFEMAALH